MKFMMIRKIFCLSTFLLAISTFSIPLQAGQLYRFPNEDGVPTLSRSLPPEAAQKGYEILDDKTMRVIDHVTPAPTEAEIIELKAQQAREAERKRQADIAAKEAEKQREKQALYDRTLLMTYPTEADLIDARKKDITYRQEQIGMLSVKIPAAKKRLEEVQKAAAERELSGKKISNNMQKRLDAAQEEITVRQQAIERYQAEIKKLNEQYDADLKRLRQLRGTDS